MTVPPRFGNAQIEPILVENMASRTLTEDVNGIGTKIRV
jgi:hypothetical protein